MTQDEIIRSPLGRDQIIDLAREASPDMTWYAATEDPTQVATEELEFLERFAALVAAHEREACAKVCEKRSHRNDDMGAICAAAIRARGQDGTD